MSLNPDYWPQGATLNIKTTDVCEGCGKPARHGARAFAFAIGGGWAYACPTCFAKAERARMVGEVLDMATEHDGETPIEFSPVRLVVTP